MTKRAPTAHPLTPAELRVVELVAEGLTLQQIADRLERSVLTIRQQVSRAGAKIPGDLPLTLRITNWYRGGETWRLPARSSS